MARESFIQVLERIIATPVLATGTNTLKVGAVIVSNVGRTEPQLITTPTQLLSEYTETGKITPASHPTLIAAFRLASTCDLIVQRAITPGTTINYYAPNDAAVIAEGDVDTEKANHGFLFRFDSPVTNLDAAVTANRQKIQVKAISSSKTYEFIYNGVTYTASLNPTAVDANGVSIYYENLNESLPITFIPGGLDEDTLTWADSDTTIYNVPVTMDLTDVGAWSTAGFAGLDDQEIDLIDIVSDMNFQNVTYQAKAIASANTLLSTAIVGFPETAVTKALIDNHITAIGATSSKTVAVAQTERLSSRTGFYTSFSLAMQWIEKLAANKALLQEFAPMHGQTNATIVPGNLNVKIGKTLRESLLDSNVVTLRTFKGVTYFNDNTTFTSTNNVMKESQNRLFQQKVARDVAHLMRQFEGLENTTQTRQSVVDLIENYFNKIVAPQKFRPERWEIVCSRSNNTDATIRANELHLTIRVRYRNSIKFINVLQEAYPVGVAFSA